MRYMVQKSKPIKGKQR